MAVPPVECAREKHMHLQPEKFDRLAGSRVAGSRDRDALATAGKGNVSTVKVLGEGAFGIVDLVLVEIVPGASAGLRQQQPLLCIRKKLLHQTPTNPSDPKSEVAFLTACQGEPFIIQLWSHIEGLYDMTLLLEYCPYGGLDGLLEIVNRERSHSSSCLTWLTDSLLGERHTGLTEQEARFYAACTIIGLSALHARHILHRDLKPANLLVSEAGYVKLGDLGLGKQLGDGDDSKAHTHAGTPGYMAPEVLHAKDGSSGYSYPADVWSLGMVIWELVEGQLPRWAPLSWYWTLTPAESMPTTFSPALRSLLTGLLQKAPRDRLKLETLKQHEWFAGLDWSALESGQLMAPCVPELEVVHAQLAAQSSAVGVAKPNNK